MHVLRALLASGGFLLLYVGLFALVLRRPDRADEPDLSTLWDR